MIALLYLLFVGGGLWSLAWAYRKFGKKSRPGAPGSALEVLERTHLDPRNYCALLRVGRKVLVVGVTRGSGMAPLSEVTDPGALAELMEQARPKSAAGRGVFAQLFQRQFMKTAPEAAACGFSGELDPMQASGQAPSEGAAAPAAPGEAALRAARPADGPDRAAPAAERAPALARLYAAAAARRGAAP